MVYVELNEFSRDRSNRKRMSYHLISEDLIPYNKKIN